MSATRSLPASGRSSWFEAATNFGLFQFGWFACVLGAAQGYAAAGTACALVVVAIHLVRSRRPLEEAKLQACLIVLGLVVDTALLATGALRYTSGHFPGALGAVLAPHWIVASWMLLGTALNVTLRWLKGRWLLASVLGAVATPWSYWAGVRLGAGVFVDAPLALGLIAVGWALWMPLLVRLGSKFDGGGES